MLSDTRRTLVTPYGVILTLGILIAATGLLSSDIALNLAANGGFLLSFVPSIIVVGTMLGSIYVGVQIRQAYGRGERARGYRAVIAWVAVTVALFNLMRHGDPLIGWSSATLTLATYGWWFIDDRARRARYFGNGGARDAR